MLGAVTFEMIPLGVYGGATDGNLSSYMLRLSGSDKALALDAGSLVNGLMQFDQQQTIADKLFQIKTYLISHAHFDHTLGFIIASPDFTHKPGLMARKETLAILKKRVFHWDIWGNFGDSGQKPQLNFIRYQQLELKQWHDLPDVDNLMVKTYHLNHGFNYPSSAFLIKSNDSYILYLGDTGADSINQDDTLVTLWRDIAPLIAKGQLKALFMECSFSDEQPDKLLYGHLKPSLYVKELETLANLAMPDSPGEALRNFPVFVSHVKPEIGLQAEKFGLKILQQLKQGAQQKSLQINFILPKQGMKYYL